MRVARVLIAVLASGVMAPLEPLKADGNESFGSAYRREYWSGYYLGAFAGYGLGPSRFDFTGIATTTRDFEVEGGILGGTAGFNLQIDHVLWGLEADFGWSGIRGSNGNRSGSDCNGPVAFGGTGFLCSTESSVLGTARGRLGWAAGSFLPYFTAGAAFANIKARVGSDPGLSTFGGEREFRAGWTIGGGIEWKHDHTSIKAEYLYVNFANLTCGQQTVAGGAGCSPLTLTNVFLDEHVVRLGLNWHFQRNE